MEKLHYKTAKSPKQSESNWAWERSLWHHVGQEKHMQYANGVYYPFKQFNMEQCPFEKQTVSAQVLELYNRKTKEKKAQVNIH